MTSSTWTGAESRAWTSADNWAPGAPTPFSQVRIDNGTLANQPMIVGTAQSIAGLLLQSAGASLTIAGAGGSLAVASNVTQSDAELALAGGTLTVGGLYSLSGDISGTGAVVLGTGGALRASRGQIGAGVVITGSGPDAFRFTGPVTVAGQLAGATAAVRIEPAVFQTVRLDGANSFGGGVTLAAGRVIVGHDSALGTGTLRMADLTTLSASAEGIVLANDIDIVEEGRATIDAMGRTLTLNGAISGGRVLFMDGGQLVLGGANTFAGGLVATNGTVTITHASALGTGQLDLGDMATLRAGAAGLAVANRIVLGAGGEGDDSPVIDTDGFDLTLSGVLSRGRLRKIGAGTLTLSGANDFTGDLEITAGALTNTGSLAGRVVNAASFTNAGTAAAGLTNTGTATNSGTLSGPVANEAGALLRSTGTIAATTFRNAGAAELAGQLSAAEFSNSGTVLITSPLTGAVERFDNLAGGRLALGAGRSLTVGSLANAGAVDLANGDTSNRLIVNGAFAGGGRLIVDVNVATGEADRLIITGGASGTTSVAINQIGIPSDHPDAVVISGGTGGQFLAEGALPAAGPSPFANGGGQLISTGGLRAQWFGERAPGEYVVRSDVDTGAVTRVGSTLAGALAALNAFNEPASAAISSLNEPASAFIGGGVADPTPNRFSIGAWSRTRVGAFDIGGASVATRPAAFGGGAIRQSSQVDARFIGFQAGLDFGLHNIAGSGWAFNAGFHGGFVDAQAGGAGTRLEVNQPFFGAYAALRSGRFSIDGLIRHDTHNMKVSDAALGLFQRNLKGSGWSGLVSAQYRIDIGDRFYVDPSVALLYSRADIDDLPVTGGTIGFAPIESLTARFGLQVGTWIELSDRFTLAPYAAFSLWHEMMGRTRSTGTVGAVTVPVASDQLGTFGQASLGLAASYDQGLSAFVRADTRFGHNIRGYGLNGGVRYQF